MTNKRFSKSRGPLYAALITGGLMALSPQVHAAHWEMSYKLDGTSLPANSSSTRGPWDQRQSGRVLANGGAGPAGFSALAQQTGVVSGSTILATAASVDGSITVYLKWVQDYFDDPNNPLKPPKVVLLRLTGYSYATASGTTSNGTVETKLATRDGKETLESTEYNGHANYQRQSRAIASTAEPDPSSAITIPLAVPDGNVEIEKTFALKAKATTQEMEYIPDNILGGSEAYLSFNAAVQDIRFSLFAAPDSPYSFIKNLDDDKEIDTYARLSWKDVGAVDSPLVPFYAGSSDFFASGTQNSFDFTPSDFQWTASPQTYVPQLPVLSESERRYVVPEGSTSSKHFHWDFGDTSQNPQFPKDANVTVSATEPTSGAKLDAKVLIHWHRAFEGVATDDASDPSRLSSFPGTLVTMAPFRDDSLQEHHPDPKPIDQVQPGEKIFIGSSKTPRTVTGKETLPDGTIVLHTTVDPDDLAEGEQLDLQQQQDRIHDAYLDVQHTGAKYVKDGLEAYVTLAEWPYYEVGGAAFGALAGKALELAKVGVEASGMATRARQISAATRETISRCKVVLAQGVNAEEAAQLTETIAKLEKNVGELDAGAADLDEVAVHAKSMAEEAEGRTPDVEAITEEPGEMPSRGTGGSTPSEQVQELTGHGHERHGSQTTIAEQTTRVQTGVSPEGAIAKTSRATRFDSDEAELDAISRAKARLSQEIANGKISTAITVRPNGRTELPTERFIVTGYQGGYGSGVEVIRDASGIPLPGRPVQPTGQDPNALVWLQYKPSTGTWEPITQYPTNQPVTTF